jgi:DNA-binding winged helix-turn-helix (wHTH) protein/TolB-like protein
MEGDFQVGPWLAQPRLNRIARVGKARHVEPKVMQVLAHLADHPGDVVSKDELMRAVWRDTFVTDDALLRCISELRKALEDDSREPRYIQTVPKVGYRLLAEVVPAGRDVVPARPGDRLPALGRRKWILLLAAGAAAVIALVAVIAFQWHRRQTAQAGRRIMLVVLPLQNLSGDPSQEYLSDGLTEEMITQLARLQPERLGVIARTTAMRYARAGKKISQIGAELGVDYVLEGSVRREGGKRVQARRRAEPKLLGCAQPLRQLSPPDETVR